MKIMKFDVENCATSSVHWFNVKKQYGIWRVIGVRVCYEVKQPHHVELITSGFFLVDEPKTLEALKGRLGDKPC